MQIKEIDISCLSPYENNAKLYPEKQIEQIAKSIEEFGFIVPILIDSTNTIIAGHGRYFAAKKLEMETVPAILIDHLSDVQRKAFIIADNKLNMNTGFDLDLLKSELESIDIIEFSKLGFDAMEIEEMFSKEVIPNEDSFEKEVNKKKMHFSFSNVYDFLNTHGIKYFCLFRNNEMDLEELKKNIKNIDPFVYPLINYLKFKNIKKIAIAPTGERAELNKFHFATELLKACKNYYDFDFIEIFENVRNRITLKSNVIESEKYYLFDDIVTRGNTLKKMIELSNIKNAIILITNH